MAPAQGGSKHLLMQQSAPLTPKQIKAFPEIQETGGRIVGAGKPGFPGGTQIPPTEVQVRDPAGIRPRQ